MSLEAAVEDALARESRRLVLLGLDPDDPDLAGSYREAGVAVVQQIADLLGLLKDKTDLALARLLAGRHENLFCQECGLEQVGRDRDPCFACGGESLGVGWAD